MGLGGAEFRLPVLKGPMRYSAKEAVPLNLSVSLVTLMVSLLTRAGTLPLAPLAELAPIVISLAVSATAAAFFGTAIVRSLTERRLELMILVLLVAVGAALIVESGMTPMLDALVVVYVDPEVQIARDRTSSPHGQF